MAEKKFYGELNIIRAFVVLLVVLIHSSPDADKSLFPHYLMEIGDGMMWLFFSVSGFLSCEKLHEEKVNLKLCIYSKFARLMVPYLIYSFAALILKFVFASYTAHEINSQALLQIFLGNSPNVTLWFLWSLFMTSVIFHIISWICCKLSLKSSDKTVVFVLAGIVLFAMSYFIYADGTGIKITLSYSLAYSAGIFVYKNYEKFTSLFTKIWIIFIAFISLVFILSWEINAYTVTCVLVSYLLWSVCYIIENKLKATAFYRGLSVIGKYSLDIYLLSYFVQVFMRVLTTSIFDFSDISAAAIIFLSGTVVPILISEYFLRRFKILRILLLGMKK